MNAHRSTTVTDADGQQPSMAVVDLIAEETGIGPLELDPLYNAVDPEALDAICADSSGFSRFKFEYAGHTVVIDGTDDGVEISLEPVTIGANGSSGFADSGPSA